MTSHGVEFEVTKRGPDRHATEWGAWCHCNRARAPQFYGPTYEDVEDQWRRHVHEKTGRAPEPLGATGGRWMP